MRINSVIYWPEWPRSIDKTKRRYHPLFDKGTYQAWLAAGLGSKAQQERGLAAVVATHNVKLARPRDRVLRLRDGVLAPVRPPEPGDGSSGTGDGSA